MEVTDGNGSEPTRAFLSYRSIYLTLGGLCALLAVWLGLTLTLFFLGWLGFPRPLGSSSLALGVYAVFFHDPGMVLPGKDIAAALLYSYLLYKSVQGARHCFGLARGEKIAESAR